MNNNWISTNSGKQFFPLAPRVEDVDVLDIARALSHQCRYAGHTDRFYSVAEHAVHVSLVVAGLGGDVDAQMWALHHDDSEAYLVDVPRPLKIRPEFAAYREAETRLMAVIATALGLVGGEPEMVKRVDRQMVALEAEVLLPVKHRAWQSPELVDDLRRWVKIGPWSPDQARVEFLNRHRELGGKVYG